MPPRAGRRATSSRDPPRAPPPPRCGGRKRRGPRPRASASCVEKVGSRRASLEVTAEPGEAPIPCDLRCLGIVDLLALGIEKGVLRIVPVDLARLAGRLELLLELVGLLLRHPAI